MGGFGRLRADAPAAEPSQFRRSLPARARARAAGRAAAVSLLVLAAVAVWPGVTSVQAAPSTLSSDPVRDEYRSQMILPLALGADSGRRMGAGAAVRPLAAAPERAQVELTATLGGGDSLAAMLQRAGVGPRDAAAAAALIGQAVPARAIAPGTEVQVVLGRRPAPGAARSLAALSLRARFDLDLAVKRSGGGLVLERRALAVDDRPLRIRGLVGSSLYRSARAAGAPASAVQQYLRTLAEQGQLGEGLLPTDTYDFVVAYRRAASGEVDSGKLLFAGVERGGKPRAQLLRWGPDGQFLEASGVGQQREGLLAPVPGRITSHFGMRRHPILRYARMHSGLDFKAGYGTPILAVTDAVVQAAGRMGGCGNAVRLAHGGDVATRYCHLSQLAVAPGQAVRRGQVIGYVGSTGLSTGPHLHYEMYRGGRAIDPASVRFVTRAQLEGAELASFRQALATLKAITPGPR